MDLAQTIQHLYAEKQRLEHVIAALEELQAADFTLAGIPGRSRRGRKFMAAKEREEVSKRMKNYWANRRKQAKQAKEV